jgi:hypothetical protein
MADRSAGFWRAGFTVAMAIAVCGCGGKSSEAGPAQESEPQDSGSEAGPAQGSGPQDSGPEAATCAQFDYTKYTPKSTSVSLLTDIAPIIKTSCALTKTCHGSVATVAADADPQLGPISGIADMATAQKVHDAIVGIAAKQAPSMSEVTAGDPEHSWLMKKLEGSQNCAGVTCTKIPGASSPCGDLMPPMPATSLPADQVMEFRDWIKGGAAL